MTRSLPTARLRINGVHHAMRDIGSESTVCGLRPVKIMPAGIYPVGCKHCLRVLVLDTPPTDPYLGAGTRSEAEAQFATHHQPNEGEHQCLT